MSEHNVICKHQNRRRNLFSSKPLTQMNELKVGRLMFKFMAMYCCTEQVRIHRTEQHGRCREVNERAPRHGVVLRRAPKVHAGRAQVAKDAAVEPNLTRAADVHCRWRWEAGCRRVPVLVGDGLQ